MLDASKRLAENLARSGTTQKDAIMSKVWQSSQHNRKRLSELDSNPL